MEFKDFKKLMQDHFAKMTSGGSNLFTTRVDNGDMWDFYLNSFPPGTNEIFRTRREYDCSCCRHFIKEIGSVVSIKDGLITTIWDFEVNDDIFSQVAQKMAEYVRTLPIDGVYFSKEKKIGTDKNRGWDENNVVSTYEHFYLELPSHLVNSSNRTINDVRGEYIDTYSVFKRSLQEILLESIDVVLDLIADNTLYKGKEWKGLLESFRQHKVSYDKKIEEDKKLYCWENAIKAGISLGRIRNHSIGVLLTDISEGMELDAAVRRYEAIVAPANYKRPKPVFTQQMLEDAKKTVSEMGYGESLTRRFAVLEDISVNNVLFANRDSVSKMIAPDIFEKLSTSIPIDSKKFNRIEEIGIEQFISNVLPNTRNLEVFMENRFEPNFVSLIAPVNPNAPSMFKWGNAFSWAYSGNITDSHMKERVKSAGGNVDGVLRFSIQWNDGKEYDGNDLDAHCFEPGGNHIYYYDKWNINTGGVLDVDIQYPILKKPAVENITWSMKNKMKVGTYVFYVNNYKHNGGREGFRAEIEFDGQIYSFSYDKEIKHSENIKVAEVFLDAYGNFSIKEYLKSSMANCEIWGVNTNQFIPVSTALYSPNYWDQQNGIGHRHYFFMLKDCVNPEKPNGFYNEFLKPELEKHRRVFEALGAKTAVQNSENQLSGIGFSSTKRNELTVRVTGATERILKIKF